MNEIPLHLHTLGKQMLIIAEVAQAHDGSLGMAHAFIDAVARTGADGIKFQTHIAAAESTTREPWRVKFSYQDATRYDYWRRMEFTEEQWHGLKKHADERKLLFISSPFSMDAVELLKKVGVAAWKIASGEVNNIPMFDRMAETRLPFLLSTGMSSLSEVDAAVEWIKGKGIPLVVFQCTSSYPCPPEKVGLNQISFFRDRYNCPTGLSDHSGTIYPGLAAATLKAAALEIHVTLSREMFGPDVPASVNTSELAQLVEGVRFIEKMLANPVDKNEVAQEMASTRSLFTKSIVVCKNLSAGTVLEEAHLTAKKPGTGISPDRIGDFVGRRLLRDMEKDDQLHEEDCEEPPQ